MIGRLGRESDDEFGGVTLLAKEPVQDEGVDQTCRMIRSEAQAAHDVPADLLGRQTLTPRLYGPPEPLDEARERLAAHAHSDQHEPPPDPRSERRTQGEGQSTGAPRISHGRSMRR
jgi:hypothetical protein